MRVADTSLSGYPWFPEQRVCTWTADFPSTKRPRLRTFSPLLRIAEDGGHHSTPSLPTCFAASAWLASLSYRQSDPVTLTPCVDFLQWVYRRSSDRATYDPSVLPYRSDRIETTYSFSVSDSASRTQV